MKPRSPDIVLSFSDLKKALFAKRKTLLIVALLCSALCFSKAALRPMRYTAKGIFKEHKAKPQALPSIAVELLAKMEGNSSTEADPLELIASLPLLERVVRTLNLQAHLCTQKKTSAFVRLFYALKGEWLSIYYGRWHRPSSRILPKGQKVADALPFREKTPPLQVSAVSYDQELYKKVMIHFKSDHEFVVLGKKKKPLATGALNKKCVCPFGSFTLRATSALSFTNKSYPLTFIPVREAALGIQKRLRAKRDALAPSLIHLSYTHTNRHLGAAIVNAVMEEYRLFIKAETEKKAHTQLGYLNERLDKTQETLQNIIDEQMLLLSANAQGGEFFSLEDEMAFLSQTQAKKREMLALASSQIEQLESLGIASLKKEDLKPYLGLSIQGAQQFLLETHQKRESLNLSLCNLKNLQHHLDDPTFELLSLSEPLNDPTLAPLFQKVRTLRLDLENQAHFTNNELAAKKRELALTKNFFRSHLEQLIASHTEKETLLAKEIAALQATLLSLYRDNKHQLTQELNKIATQMSTLPKRWQVEQKMAASTEFSGKMVETLAHLIESKNVSLNLEYVASGPLLLALPPTLPLPPKVFLFAIFGFIGGAFCVFLWCVCKVLYQGPTASVSNLKHLGFSVLGALTSAKEPTWHQVALAVSQENPSVLLCSSLCSSALFAPLQALLEVQTERCITLDFSKENPSFFEALSQKDSAPPTPSSLLYTKPSSPKEEALLRSNHFAHFVKQCLDNAELLIFIGLQDPHSSLYQTLASNAPFKLHIVTQEKPQDLPSSCHFVVQEKPLVPEKLPLVEISKKTLKKIEPLVARLLLRLSKKNRT